MKSGIYFLFVCAFLFSTCVVNGQVTRLESVDHKDLFSALAKADPEVSKNSKELGKIENRLFQNTVVQEDLIEQFQFARSGRQMHKRMLRIIETENKARRTQIQKLSKHISRSREVLEAGTDRTSAFLKELREQDEVGSILKDDSGAELGEDVLLQRLVKSWEQKRKAVKESVDSEEYQLKMHKQELARYKRGDESIAENLKQRSKLVEEFVEATSKLRDSVANRNNGNETLTKFRRALDANAAKNKTFQEAIENELNGVIIEKEAATLAGWADEIHALKFKLFEASREKDAAKVSELKNEFDKALQSYQQQQERLERFEALNTKLSKVRFIRELIKKQIWALGESID